MALIAYKERYCAFIDILGFKGLVGELGRDRSKATTLRNTLLAIHDHSAQNSSPKHIDFRTQSISDALVISALPISSGLFAILYSLEKLTMRLLVDGYFLRGVVVKGRLYHDDNMAFGEALVKAYQYETTVVRYPRIMILSEIPADVSHENFSMVFAHRFKQAFDGPVYLHVLRQMQADMNRVPAGSESDAYAAFPVYRQIQLMLVQRIREAADNPRHFEKVQWFANYWNESLPQGASAFSIRGPGIKPRESLPIQGDD